MELLYVWIEKYKNIKEQGFNFSSKHHFEFIPKKSTTEKIIGGKLHHQQNSNHIQNFFGENITNVTAIIGENGVGKSSLLEALVDILPEPISYEWKYLIVFEDNNKVLNVSSSFGKINSPKYIKDTFAYHFNKSYHIFYKEILDMNDYSTRHQMHSLEKFIDLSIANALFKASFMDNVYEEFDKQIDFVINSNIQQNYIFQYPQSFTLNESRIMSESLATRKESSDINDYISTITAQKHEWLEYRIKVFFLKKNGYVYQQIFAMTKKQLNQTLLQRFSKRKNANPNDIIRLFKILTDKLNYQINDYLPRYSVKEDNKKIKELYNLLRKTGLHEYFILGWSWERTSIVGGMSSGELKLLTLLSKFYSIRLGIEKKKDIVILIDEGETGFHPQWQKEYLKILVVFLPQIFTDNKIQIILTSHSPFLISDLPKENIIFLSKDTEGKCIVSQLQDRKETFGSNIHTLFTDSFFMKGGLIGSFAQDKINQVIDLLNEDIERIEENEDFIKKVIEMIGEPILKKQLLKMLDDKLILSSIGLNKKIKEMEKEIEKLKSKTKNL